MKDVEYYIRRFESVRSKRHNFENRWQELLQYVNPAEADIVTKRVEQGTSKTDKVYDATPILACKKMAASLHGMLIGFDRAWFKIESADDEINENDEALAWFDLVTKRMQSAIHDPRAGFTQALDEVFMDISAVGNGIPVTMEAEDIPVEFGSWGVKECYIVTDASGRIEGLFRMREFTAQQLAWKYNEEGDSLHQSIADMLAANSEQKIDVLHAILPRDDYSDAFNAPAKMKRYESIHIDYEHKHVMRESGFDEMPAHYGRWRVNSDEEYGRGAGDDVFPDIKMLNSTAKANILSKELALRPPLDIDARAYPKGLRLYSGAQNMRRNMTQGPAVQPINTIGVIEWTQEQMESLKSSIREAFYVDIFQLAEAPNMTAFEVAQRLNEKLRLMAPMLGRIQSEILNPMLERVFSIMLRRGDFGGMDEIPEVVSGTTLKIRYLSQVAQAIQASEVDNIMQAFGAMEIFGQKDPTIYDNFNFDELGRDIYRIFGLSPDALRERDDVVQIRQNRAAAQQQAQEMNDAMLGAEMQKTMAEAQRATIQ